MNLTDVLVAPATDRGRLRAGREAIAALGVRLHRPGEGIGVEAARLRAAHPISLSDAYCLATARYMDAAVASFDEKVLRTAEQEGLAAAEVRVRRPRRR